MSPAVRLRPARIALYGLALSVIYLAGVYLGGTLLVVFYAVLLVPLFSLAQAIVTRATLRYHQEFTNDHPSKGEAVGYRLSLTNESILPSAVVVASFHAGRQEEAATTETMLLAARETHDRDHTVRCPYRGIYTVGLSRLEVWDLFGWVGFGLPVFSRTFYVYPRVITLADAFSGFGTEQSVSQDVSGGREMDYTLFRGLRSCRPDDDVRHIAWHKLASTGSPLVREYDTAAQPSVCICLDTRPAPSGAAPALAVEDASIEIAVALVKHYMDREIPVAAAAAGQVLQFEPLDNAAFLRFHRLTITLFFRSLYSPAVLHESNRTNPTFAQGTVIFVTHMLDPDVLDLVERSDGVSLQAAAVVNTLALSAEERVRAVELHRSYREGGRALVLVDSVEALHQEIAQWYAGSSV